MKHWFFSAALFALFASPALANTFWRVTEEQDPFTNVEYVTADQATSNEVGVSVHCRTDDRGLWVNMAPGWAATSATYPVDTMRVTRDFDVAIDNQPLYLKAQYAKTEIVERNLVVISVHLDAFQSKKLVDGMIEAHSRVSFRDGASQLPIHFTADSSTRAGFALRFCMNKQ